MNLWVSRVRQLAVLAVALFFYSCTDDPNLLGYKNPNSKFDVKYIELPVESSVLLDSVRGSNFYNYSTETQRLLVGKYLDDKFGEISSSACTQFFTTSGTKLTSTAQFMSVSLQLQFDYYTYGASKSATPQDITIYEINEELDDSLNGTYFTTKPILIKPEPLGSKSFSVDPTEFQKYIDDEKDTVRTVEIALDTENGYAFGSRIFNSAIRYRDAVTLADSTFVNYSEFVKQFYGIAIVPNGSDKVVGFSAASAASKIIIHYRTDTDTLQLSLTFNSTAGYNNITSSRGATQLGGLTQYNQEFYPADDKRYIQSGAGIVTKIDIGAFLDFSKDIPNMIINSAELVVGDVEDGVTFDPPNNLVLRVLKENNLPYVFGTKNTQATKDYSLYKGFIVPDYAGSPLGVVIDNDSTFTVVGDLNSYALLTYSKSAKKYNGYLTRFLQQVYSKDEGKTPLRYLALYSASPSFSKSVNRVVFPKNSIKLRVYYTIPTVKD